MTIANPAATERAVARFLREGVSLALSNKDQIAYPVAQHALAQWEDKQNPFPDLEETWKHSERLGARYEASRLMNGLIKIIDDAQEGAA